MDGLTAPGSYAFLACLYERTEELLRWPRLWGRRRGQNVKVNYKMSPSLWASWEMSLLAKCCPSHKIKSLHTY